MHKLLGALSFAAIAALTTSHANAQSATSPADSLAAQVRIQGFICATPVKATRDKKRSRADSAVWIVRCGNASYRMRLDPNQAAKIEPLG